MKNPPTFRHQRILPAAAPSASDPASPFTRAVSAYRSERRKSLRMLTLFSALVLVGAAVSLAVLGRRTGHLPPTETRYAMPARPLPETENNFQRLLAENMMLKEELRKAEAMNQDLQSLILRESIDSVAEEAKPATEAPDSKAALPSALPTESTGHSPLPDHGSATTRLACPAPTLPVT